MTATSMLGRSGEQVAGNFKAPRRRGYPLLVCELIRAGELEARVGDGAGMGGVWWALNRRAGVWRWAFGSWIWRIE